MVLSEDRLNVRLVEFTGDEDKLIVREDDGDGACYRLDTKNAYRKDADVADWRVLRNDVGVYVFLSRVAAYTFAIDYLEGNISKTLMDNINTLRAERKAMMPKPMPRKGGKRVAKPVPRRAPAPAC